MFSIWLLIGIAVVYLGLMFVVGYLGDKYLPNRKPRPYFYSFALGVHCTTWSFFGTTTQSAQYGWAFTPTYLGAILLFAVGYPLLMRIAALCKQHQISSLAELLSLRFNRSTSIAAMVTIVTLIGVVPYTSLQLDALTNSLIFLSDEPDDGSHNASLYISILMAIFAVLFGTRSTNLTEKRSGLLAAIAFESLVKLVAFVGVAIYICYGIFDGMFDLITQAGNNETTRKIMQGEGAWLAYLGHMLLGFCSMICLPRQFHINFVEYNSPEEITKARWVFPLYLAAINLFVLPIALAGTLQFNDTQLSPDLFILALPQQQEQAFFTLLGYLGGLAAATSMIIVATLAVGIMLANNLVTPIWLKRQLRAGDAQGIEGNMLLMIRRTTVLLVIGVSYLYYQTVGQTEPLANSGILSIALLAQFIPALLMSLYWKNNGVFSFWAATLAGIVGWLYLLLWPSIKHTYAFAPAPTDADLSQGFLISLGINISLYLLFNNAFYTSRVKHQDYGEPVAIQSEQLHNILTKLLTAKDYEKVRRFLKDKTQSGYISPQMLSKVEKILSAYLGQGGSRMLLTTLTNQKKLALDDLLVWVEEASQTFQFNQELLQASMQHIEQGICVIDRQLNLVAWNQYYETMFSYPENYLQAGLSMKSILQFNARRGLLGKQIDANTEIQKRLDFLTNGSRYKYRRYQPDGSAIEIQGSPMPGGGFVTTYTDITDLIRTQQELERSKDELEKRVENRTKALSLANKALAQANLSKTRFLAAAGHDLMQPFNAATLYASLLAEKTKNTDLAQTSDGLKQALHNAEELLTGLLDFSKLESGVLRPSPSQFQLNDVLGPLVAEASIVALQKGLELRYVPSKHWIETDKALFRRMIANLISNAIRYTPKGKILIGVKRRQQDLLICVADTGIGIPSHKQKEIFEEFQQLQNSESKQGLGLGLTIVERMSELLNIPVGLASTPGKGTVFFTQIHPIAPPLHQNNGAKLASNKKSDLKFSLSGKYIWIVDNDRQVLDATRDLFLSWNASVTTAKDADNLFEQVRAPGANPADLLLIDYHLDENKTGNVEAIRIFGRVGHDIPTILNSANHDDEIREQAIEAGLHFLHKPLKLASLKRLLKNIFDEK
ncbi:PAS domain-containing hybrid sensor histidine kinase/response regulator [Alteromonas sp. a30]|uniref:PAS domain-containing hybrid sensor histidine kinase/response regulator n=1 Tax=Alteromonas sp. a30 TaxID=2730917 RepID=UPI002282098E|nr:PAS-domain containing protein [Alteromonas sp. a30]MCY7296856.1 response regulator [Alteromonas sp. a30]